MSQLKEGYIRYSNDEERQAAIKYAESLGFREWSSNDDLIAIDDNCIILWHKDVFWQDNHNERAIKMGLDEIKINTKDYTDSETNCKGCIGPCGECEVEFTKKVKEAFKYPTEGNPLLPPNWVWGDGYNYKGDKYTKTESEDGTITLKPKTKVKLGLLTYFDKKHNDFRATTLMPISVVKDYEKSLKEDDQKILLEVIERQYEL